MKDGARPNRPIDIDREAALRECLAARGLPPILDHVETTPVKEGVTCDVYSLRHSDTYDLAIVEVRAGHSTPRQRVLAGRETVEGHVTGRGTLIVRAPGGAESAYEFPGQRSAPVGVEVGQIMQWHAGDNTALVFFELCAPPYTDGRFEDLDRDGVA